MLGQYTMYQFIFKLFLSTLFDIAEIIESYTNSFLRVLEMEPIT